MSSKPSNCIPLHTVREKMKGWPSLTLSRSLLHFYMCIEGEQEAQKAY